MAQVLTNNYSNSKCHLLLSSMQNCFCITDKSPLLNITVPAQQISATRSVNIISSTKDNHLPLFTIVKLCFNDTKSTGPDNANSTCSITSGVTGPDGPNATNVTVTIGKDKQTTVGKLST